MIKHYFSNARKRCWDIYTRYYGNEQYLHHEARYLEEINRLVTPDTILLDAGSGTDMPLTGQVAGKVGMAVGTDIGELKTINAGPYGVRADLGSLPFKDNVFDIVISMSVIEHLQNPRAVFAELSRVLKPGAITVLQTPNKYDYVSLIARFTPTWFHRCVLAFLLNRKEEDTFPTFFSANSKRKIVSLLDHNNFVPLNVILFNQYPAYLMFSPLLFRLGIFYERITSHFELCAQLRAWILVVAQKRVLANKPE